MSTSKSLPKRTETRATINEICRDYRNGHCRWGRRCNRIHIYVAQPMSPPRHNASLKLLISNNKILTESSDKASPQNPLEGIPSESSNESLLPNLSMNLPQSLDETLSRSSVQVSPQISSAPLSQHPAEKGKSSNAAIAKHREPANTNRVFAHNSNETLPRNATEEVFERSPETLSRPSNKGILTHDSAVPLLQNWTEQFKTSTIAISKPLTPTNPNKVQNLNEALPRPSNKMLLQSSKTERPSRNMVNKLQQTSAVSLPHKLIEKDKSSNIAVPKFLSPAESTEELIDQKLMRVATERSIPTLPSSTRTSLTHSPKPMLMPPPAPPQEPLPLNENGMPPICPNYLRGACRVPKCPLLHVSAPYVPPPDPTPTPEEKCTVKKSSATPKSKSKPIEKADTEVDFDAKTDSDKRKSKAKSKTKLEPQVESNTQGEAVADEKPQRRKTRSNGKGKAKEEDPEATVDAKTNRLSIGTLGGGSEPAGRTLSRKRYVKPPVTSSSTATSTSILPVVKLPSSTTPRSSNAGSSDPNPTHIQKSKTPTPRSQKHDTRHQEDGSQTSGSSGSDRTFYTASSNASSNATSRAGSSADDRVVAELPKRHPRPRTTKVCWNWLADRCRKGYDCKFVHRDLDYDEDEVDGAVSNVRTWSTTIFDHITVKFAPGFEIVDLNTGFETPWVILSGIPTGAITSQDEVVRLMEPFGNVEDVKLPSLDATRSPTSTKTGIASSSMMGRVRVRFSSHTEALRAVTSLHGTSMFNSKISARLPINSGQNRRSVVQDTSVQLSWEAPGVMGHGGYDTMEQARQAMRDATSTLRFGRWIVARIWNDIPMVGKVTVRYMNLPFEADNHFIIKHFDAVDATWRGANYEDFEAATRRIRDMLQECGQLVTFDILPAPFKAGTVRAWAQFSSSNEAKLAARQMDGRKPTAIGNTRLHVRHVQTVACTVSIEEFDRVAHDIASLRQSAWQEGGNVTVIDRRTRFEQGHGLRTVTVKLSNENLKALAKLKSDFDKLVHGEVVKDESGKVVWDSFFGNPSGGAYLRTMERRHPGLTIRFDSTRRVLKLFGCSSKDRELVRQMLITKTKELQRQRTFSIPVPGGVLGFFMTTGFAKLQNDFGADNISLNFLDKLLIVRGSENRFEAAVEALRHANELQGRQFSIANCPVCFGAVTSPARLPCGHSWCRSCLRNYLISAIENRNFPLTCLGNEAKCSQRISMTVARGVLSPSDFEAVMQASFLTYVHARPKEFYYCPTPDCPQIYRSASSSTVLQCPSCLLRICPTCHVEEHPGLLCPDEERAERQFNEWAEANGVKKCPGCKALIEKNEGCNHIKCTLCQTHICWVCMETFPDGQGVYPHMRTQHGGIGYGDLDFY